MNCCQCQGLEELFDDKYVSKELADYRKKGPNKTTRILINALSSEGIQGTSLLDIGGGVGAIQHALLQAGAQMAIDVDASQAYLHAARQESQRRGIADKVSFQHGNFIDLASQIPPADIVTLDRVVCCFPDMENLIGLSAAHARKLYGLVFPRDTWWVRIGIKVANFFLRLQKNPYRGFVHPVPAMEAIITRKGFTQRFIRRTFVWQVMVFEHAS